MIGFGRCISGFKYSLIFLVSKNLNYRGLSNDPAPRGRECHGHSATGGAESGKNWTAEWTPLDVNHTHRIHVWIFDLQFGILFMLNAFKCFQKIPVPWILWDRKDFTWFKRCFWIIKTNGFNNIIVDCLMSEKKNLPEDEPIFDIGILQNGLSKQQLRQR